MRVSGRHSGSRSLAARAAVPVALVVLIAVIVAIWRVASPGDSEEADRQGPGGCSEASNVLAAPEVAETVRAALDSSGCGATVEEAAPAEVEQRVLAGDVPTVWVPDSSVWPARLAARAEATGLTPQVVGSLAASPVVVVAPAEPDAASWAEVVSSEETVLGSPLTDSASTLAVLGARADAGDEAEAVQASLVGRAQATDPSQADVGVEDRLATLDATTVVSEQQWLAHRPELLAAAPGARAPVFDYPVVVLGGEDEQEAAAELADLIVGAVAEEAVVSAREAADLRAPDLSGGAGVGEVEPIEADPEAAVEIVTTWSALTVPSNALAVIDISGSMNERLGDGRRLEVAVGAALVSLELFSDRSSLGLWEFGIEIGPNEEDFAELVPIAALNADEGGVSHRERLVEALQSIEARPGVGTGLYDTVLAAYRATREDYRDDAVNSVIVITDGRNEDPGSIELAALIETLQDEADPERPVAVHMIGISEDADAEALEEIAAATGGAAHIAVDPGSNPEELADLFRAIVAARQVVPTAGDD